MDGKVVVGHRAIALRAYSAYGYLGCSAGGGLLGYNGQFLDLALQGYALGNGHRLYNPALMRFLHPDGLSPFKAGGINAYAYCSGDPVNRWDPTGKLGQKSGLTALLKEFGLSKKDLKFHLKSLAKQENKGKQLTVIKRTGDEFRAYHFTGDYPKITGVQNEFVDQRAYVAGVFFVKGNIYIRSPSYEAPGAHLVARGYRREVLASETHAIITFPSSRPSQSTQHREPPGLSQRQPSTPNDYGDVIRRR